MLQTSGRGKSSPDQCDHERAAAALRSEVSDCARAIRMAADRWFGDIRRAIPQQRDDGIEIFILAGGGFAVSRRSLLLALGLSKRGPQRGAERLATFIETLDAGSSDGIRLASALRHPFLLRAANAGPTAHAYAADLVIDMSRLCRNASKSSDTSASARELANRIDMLASRLGRELQIESR